MDPRCRPGARRCASCGDFVDEFDPSQPDRSDELLRRETCERAQRDGVIAAVKWYRETTGCDLETAMHAVEQLTAGDVDALPAVEAEILRVAQDQGKIAAIKRHREQTGSSLKEAKDAVEELLQLHGVRPGEPSVSSGCAGVLLLLLGAGSSWWLML